jgi:hypothetical protein
MDEDDEIQRKKVKWFLFIFGCLPILLYAAGYLYLAWAMNRGV